MIYITIVLLLLTGCVADTYSPKSWPRAIVTQANMEDPVEAERVEKMRRGVALINKAVGAAVYTLAVTDDIEDAGCSVVVMEYVDVIVNNWGVPTTDYRGMHSLFLRPCQSYIQLSLSTGHPGDVRTPADETTIVHELMHNLLGHEHDTEEPSVFFGIPGCLPSDPSSEVRYEAPEYCGYRHASEITQDLIDRIRAKMKI